MKLLYFYSEKEAENTESMHYFNDNGLPCDGALLSANFDAADAETLVAAGYAVILDGYAANDDAMLNVLHMAPRADGEDLEEDTVDRMKEAADTFTSLWSHYGAYGAGDSSWYFVPLAAESAA